MTLKKWLLYHHKNIVFGRCSWMGIPVFKNPLDCWIYQEIIHEIRPDVVVELGSAAGGSTLYLAHLLDLLGHGLVISVDVDRSAFRAEHDRIRSITGKTDDPDVVKEVAELCHNKRTIVIHDADHNKSQVLADMHLYAPYVSVGSYLIVEDGIVDLFRPYDGLGWLRDGPLPAINQFLKENIHFQIDEGRERYILTYNPRGFLRRMR